jgi:hypothetical protein
MPAAELSPNSVRAFLPGFAYQSTGVLASSVVYIEAVYAQKTSYASAMALTAVSVFALASIMAALAQLSQLKANCSDCCRVVGDNSFSWNEG